MRLVPQARQEPQEILVHLVKPALLERLEHQELMVRLARQENKARRETLEHLA